MRSKACQGHNDCSMPWLRPPLASARDSVAKVCWCTGFTALGSFTPKDWVKRE